MSLAEAARHLNLRRRKIATPELRVCAGAAILLPPVILMTDAKRLRDPIAAVRSLPRGAAVILRHYELVSDARAALARSLRAATRARGIRLLIADDPRLALAVGADGLHFSEWRLRHAGRRLHLKPHWLVTAAAHSAAALRCAARAGADAALLSPVFPTASHPGASAIGPLRFAALCHAARLPVYALGGISAASAQRLVGSGAVGIAGISLGTGEWRMRQTVDPARAKV